MHSILIRTKHNRYLDLVSKTDLQPAGQRLRQMDAGDEWYNTWAKGKPFNLAFVRQREERNEIRGNCWKEQKETKNIIKIT